MNPQWETFWKQDLERRAEEVRALMERNRCLMERNRCLMDAYQAKMDAYIAIAKRAGFTKDHPMARQLPDMPAMKPPEFDIPPPSIPVLDIPDIQLLRP